MIRRSISLLLLVLLAATLFVLPAAASYESEGSSSISPRYTYLNRIQPSIFTSGTTATLSGIIQGIAGVNKIEYTVYLQMKSGSSWNDVSAWPGSTNSNRVVYSFEDFVRIGTSYRTKTVVTAYSGSQSETVTAYSGEQVA